MKRQQAKEMRELALPELAQKISSLRQELFSLQLTSRTSHVKNYAQFQTLRRDIARALTVLNEKRAEAYANAVAEAIKQMMASTEQ